MEFRYKKVVGAAYADPMKLMGVPGDLPKSDVYALGVMLYELLGVKLPFDVSEEWIENAMLRKKEVGPMFGEDQ